MADDRVIFEIRAENDQLKQKLAETETKLDQLKAKADSADASGLGFRKSVQSIRSWIGAVGGAVAVATSFYVIGQKIRDTYDSIFTSGADKAKKFSDSLFSADAADRAKTLSDEIDRLQTRLASSLESTVANVTNRLLGLGPQSLKDQIAALESSRADAQNQLTAQKAAKEREDAKTAAKAKLAEEEKVRQAIFDRARDDTKRLAEEGMTQEQRIEATRAEGLKRIQELTAQARTQEELTAVNALESQIVRRYQREREEMKRLNDEANQERIRQAEEQAQAYADEFRRQMLEAIQEINRANQSFFSSFSEKQNGLLLSIRQEITRIRGSIPSSGGAAGFGSGGSY